VGYGTVLAQQIRMAFQAVRQIITIAQLRHARAAKIRNEMLEILRVARISHVDDGRPVLFHHAGHRIQHRSREVPCIRNHATALVVHGRLIRGAALQVVVAEPFRIKGVRSISMRGAPWIRRIEIVGGPCGARCDQQRQACARDGPPAHLR
jgi:hypothetical protein